MTVHENPAAALEPSEARCDALRAEIERLKHANAALAAKAETAETGATLAYAERARIVGVLARIWPAAWGDDPNAPDYPVAYLDTSAGQVSFHIHADDSDHVPTTYPEEEILWDGHDTDEKWRRLNEAADRIGRWLQVLDAPWLDLDLRVDEAVREWMAAPPIGGAAGGSISDDLKGYVKDGMRRALIAAGVADLIEGRDSARDTAVELEQQNHVLFGTLRATGGYLAKSLTRPSDAVSILRDAARGIERELGWLDPLREASDV